MFITINITLEGIEKIKTEKNDNNTLKNIFFTSAVRFNVNKLWNGFSILIGWLDRTIIWFSLFIGLFQRAKIHFSPPKCATMPDKVIIILNYAQQWPLWHQHDNQTYSIGSYLAHITLFGNNNNNNSLNLLCFFNCFQSDFLLKLVPLSNCLLVSWHWCWLDLKDRSFPLRFFLPFEWIYIYIKKTFLQSFWTGCFSTSMEEWNTNNSFYQ